MADFNIAHKKTAQIEGGYANDPDDSGGETLNGIARKKDSNWRGWPLLDMIKKRVGNGAAAINAEVAKDGQLQAMILDYYKKNYWDVHSLDSINDQKVANELYDTGVNMGTGRAGLFFQRVLNSMNRNGTLYPDLKLDGQIGAKTVQCFNALNNYDKTLVWRLLNCLQGEKYISICEANPVQEKFMRSWASRVFE